MVDKTRIDVRIGDSFTKKLKVSSTVTAVDLVWYGPQTITTPTTLENGTATANITVGDVSLGLYRSVWVVTDSVYGTSSVEDGEVNVKVSVADEPIGQDLRSHAEKTLEKVEAVLEGRATTDQLSYSLNGRSLSRIPISELREWRQHLRSEVLMEKRRRGDASSRVRVRI